jgi:hypothetical protein
VEHKPGLSGKEFLFQVLENTLERIESVIVFNLPPGAKKEGYRFQQRLFPRFVNHRGLYAGFYNF